MVSTSVDVDLRLSAARVTIATAKLGRTAVATNLHGGNLTVAIGESQAFGGVVKGSFGLAKASGGADLKAQLQFADVDLEQCLGELFGIRRLEGKGNLGFAVDSCGDSVYDLTKGLNGTASLTAARAPSPALNVEQLLKRLAQSPLSGGGELRSGKTPYDLLSVNLKISKARSNRRRGAHRGPAGAARPRRLGVDPGARSRPDRDREPAGGPDQRRRRRAAPAFELPFMVQGPWDDPLLLPDLQVLMNRSGAAAPLLETSATGSSASAKPAAEPDTELATEPPVSAVPPAGATLSGE